MNKKFNLNIYDSQKEKPVQKIEETQIVEGMQNKSYIVKASETQNFEDSAILESVHGLWKRLSHITKPDPICFN